MRTANPVFRNEVFSNTAPGGIMEQLRGHDAAAAPSTTMSIRGTVIKTAVLLALCATAAAITWQMVLKNPGPAMLIVIGSLIAGLIVGFIIHLKPHTAPGLAPVYALLEGTMLGAISLALASRIGPQGTAMVFQAVLITLSILAALLGGFAFGLIRLGSTATKVVVVATMGVGLVYVASLLMRAFGFGSIGFIHSGGPIGIGFSLFVIVLASANLVLDFQFVEQGVENKAPKYMEWYAGFGLLVTLVWLYIEVLRLLSKLRRE